MTENELHLRDNNMRCEIALMSDESYNNKEYGAEDLKSVHSASIILAPCICLVRGASFVQNRVAWRGLLDRGRASPCPLTPNLSEES